MIKILIFCAFLIINLNANYEEGKEVFEKKCSTCHIGFVPFDKLKENFFEKKNKLLNLKAPTENMLAYAIMDSPKKIGDPNDEEMRQIEIEEYLKSYLEKPERFHTICDDHVIKYYDIKASMKGELSNDDYINLSYFFMNYKKHNEKEENIVLKNDSKDEDYIKKAKLEDKQIMVYVTSKSCYFCKKMDREVLSLEDVQDKVNENYIYIKVDVEEVGLPFLLEKFYKNITPTFFILDKDGKYIKQYPGSWTKNDFLEILKENIK